jgi:hypothetical protein
MGIGYAALERQLARVEKFDLRAKSFNNPRGFFGE